MNDTGIDDQLTILRHAAMLGIGTPEVRKQARLSNSFGNVMRLIVDCTAWVHFQMVPEPDSPHETVSSSRTLANGDAPIVDAEDTSVLLLAMLAGIGFKCRLVAHAYDNSPHFTHVMVQVELHEEFRCVGVQTVYADAWSNTVGLEPPKEFSAEKAGKWTQRNDQL